MYIKQYGYAKIHWLHKKKMYNLSFFAQVPFLLTNPDENKVPNLSSEKLHLYRPYPQPVPVL